MIFYEQHKDEPLTNNTISDIIKQNTLPDSYAGNNHLKSSNEAEAVKDTNDVSYEYGEYSYVGDEVSISEGK